MGNMKKLLDKNLKAFSIYALLVLLASVPAYFLIVDFIWRTELHEHNEIVALRAKQNFSTIAGDTAELRRSIEAWNHIQPEAAIVPVTAMGTDSTFTVYRRSSLNGHEETDRFHGLVTYFSAGGQPYRMTIETNIEESYETIAAITAVTAVFFLLLLGGFVVLNKQLSRKLWAPFHQTVAQLEAYDLKSQEQIPLAPTRIIEFEALHKGIRKLIGGNIAAYREQKEFTENASHELQTPLAIVQSKLDLFLQSQGLTEEQSHIIEDANQSLARVSRINKNLVLLAKIENNQFPALEKIPLAPVVEGLAGEMSDFLTEKALRLQIRSTGACTVSGNPALLEVLLTNLLMNAIRYTPQNGGIDILLDGCRLDIGNTGEKALPDDKLFKRFSAAAAHTTGTGLGLAIVRQICQLYGWQVAYHHQDCRHHFTVAFNGAVKE